MADEKWIRQDASELHRDWVMFLSPGARLAWIYLKTYVKEAAYSQKRPNVAVALGHRSAAQRWNLSVAEVNEIVAAAVDAGQLVATGGEWRVTDARGFVSERTNERRAVVCPTNDDESPQTPPNEDEQRQKGTNPRKRRRTPPNADKSGHVCHVTVSESGSETEDSETSLRSVSGGGEPLAPDGPFESAMRVMVAVHNSLGWSDPQAADVRKHLTEDSPIRSLVTLFGEAETVRMFLWAHANWTHRPTWKAVHGQRDQIREGLAGVGATVPPASGRSESVADAKARVKANLAQRQEVNRAA
ncbi:MAG: hypothetical protein ACO1SV_21745 [Fimbriimonas sp.]